jgi:tRNA 5-methylaminomethyl-2-thiouridine biosynthesis bifunctional protein
LVPVAWASASRRLGEAVPAALDMRAALTVAPAAILAQWAPQVLCADVARLQPGAEGGWVLLDAAGGRILEAEVLILTIGADIGRLLEGLPINPVRGQANWTSGSETASAAAWGGYVAPTGAGVLFGATHDRGDTGLDLRDHDHQRNRQALAAALPQLAARLADAPLQGRASIRATTPDHLPLAGPAPGAQGLYLLSGLGSRGFCLAPLLGEHVAALAVGAPSPLPSDLADLVAPDRFQRRAARKGGR